MPYQNPYMPDYRPYPAPNIPTYFPQTQFQPSQNPVQSSYATQTVPQQALHGRIVHSESEITPQEIVMDGTISIFPLADYSMIICKQWKSDGTIQTLRYIPKQDSEEHIVTSPIDELKKHIDDRFDLIEASLTKPEGDKNA